MLWREVFAHDQLSGFYWVNTAMHDGQRFVDTGKYLMQFADEVLVNCSACGAAGVVHSARHVEGRHAEFECASCHLRLSSKECHWVGPVHLTGRRPCGYCGHRWLVPILCYESPPDEAPTQLAVICPVCQRESLVDVELMPVIPHDRCCDPHFGMPLRLSTSTRLGTVWAYNQGHLDELTAYVTAKLRERDNSGNSSMFSRLPRWMKLARNRNAITKALSKLQSILDKAA